MGGKQRLTATIGQVQSYKAMSNALKITGEGYIQRKETARDRVKWVDLPSVFNERLRTGSIINLHHRDRKLFLEDASSIFSRRDLKNLKKFVQLKIKVIFCGEFMRQMSNDTIFELKYFNTNNKPIYVDADRRLWFRKNIEDQILKDLSEFQEKDSGWALSRQFLY